MLSILPSSLLRMYVGESSHMTTALFSLAKKLEPCVLFIDEIDSLLRERYDFESSVDRNIKTEFMQLWDELQRSNCRVILVGATNRPQDIDTAIQRRFERYYLIGPPNYEERKEIFIKILTGIPLVKRFDFDLCAKLTDGYTPNDIKAVCRAAAIRTLREKIHEQRGRDNNNTELEQTNLRPLTTTVRLLGVIPFFILI
jgi:ATPase family AAA domain-containing protein 1